MSLTDGINKVGYCAICDTAIYSAASLYPTDHPWRGRIRTVVSPLDNCREVKLLLRDGSHTTFTACADCAQEAAGWDLSMVHAMMLKSWEYEQSDEFRERSAARPLNELQKKHQRAWLEKQVDNIPLEIIVVTENG